MFDIRINTARKAVLVRFRGELVERDFADLDAMGRDRKVDGPFDCIFDMTHVDKIGIATDFISQRGDLPQLFVDRQRIYVVPQEDLKLFVRLYGVYQGARGWRPPDVVDHLETAFEILGVTASDFTAF